MASPARKAVANKVRRLIVAGRSSALDGCRSLTGTPSVTWRWPATRTELQRTKDGPKAARPFAGTPARAEGLAIAGASDPAVAATLPPAIGPVAMARAFIRFELPITRAEVPRAVVVAGGL